MSETLIEQKVTYSAEGVVFGNHWGGGKGSYAARPIKDQITRQDLLNKAKAMLANGSLDSGMGYESLIGARLCIIKTTVIEVEGKPFTNEETEYVNIGKLTPKQKDFLEDMG
jgi:hypothetical protein